MDRPGIVPSFADAGRPAWRAVNVDIAQVSVAWTVRDGVRLCNRSGPSVFAATACRPAPRAQPCVRRGLARFGYVVYAGDK